MRPGSLQIIQYPLHKEPMHDSAAPLTRTLHTITASVSSVLLSKAGLFVAGLALRLAYCATTRHGLSSRTDLFIVFSLEYCLARNVAHGSRRRSQRPSDYLCVRLLILVYQCRGHYRIPVSKHHDYYHAGFGAGTKSKTQMLRQSHLPRCISVANRFTE